MPGDIRDIFAGVNQYFADRIQAVVKLSLRDERAETEQQYPQVTLSLYDMQPDDERRPGGLMYSQEGEPSTGSVTANPVPIPMNLYFQLDALAEKREDDWAMLTIIGQILCDKHSKVVTQAGETLYLIPYTADVLDNVADQAFHKVYRFYVQTWFDSLKPALTKHTVTSFQFILNNEIIEIA